MPSMPKASDSRTSSTSTVTRAAVRFERRKIEVLIGGPPLYRSGPPSCNFPGRQPSRSPRRPSSVRCTHETMAGVEDLVSLPRAHSVTAGRRLQYLTIGWNSVECSVALVAGFLAGSVALVGFGFDSAIEVTSSLAALWRLRRDADELDRASAEQRTMRIIGCCFLLLATYVCYEAVRALVEGNSPDRSTVGIALAA